MYVKGLHKVPCIPRRSVWVIQGIVNCGFSRILRDCLIYRIRISCSFQRIIEQYCSNLLRIGSCTGKFWYFTGISTWNTADMCLSMARSKSAPWDHNVTLSASMRFCIVLIQLVNCARTSSTGNVWGRSISAFTSSGRLPHHLAVSGSKSSPAMNSLRISTPILKYSSLTAPSSSVKMLSDVSAFLFHATAPSCMIAAVTLVEHVSKSNVISKCFIFCELKVESLVWSV